RVGAVAVADGLRAAVGLGDPAHQRHVGTQVAGAQFYEVVALLPERARGGPAPLRGDVDHGQPDAQVLRVADDLGEVFVAAHHDRVADGVVAGQRHQVAVD